MLKEENLLYFENYDGNSYENKVITISHSQQQKRLDIVLSTLYPNLSRSRIKNWILIGAATLNGSVSKPSTQVKFGQILEICPPNIPNNACWKPEAISLNIIHEDSSLIVLNKPSGLVVHPGAGNPNGTLLNGLIHHCSSLKKLPRAGLVHRLDKDTSGLLVVAKTLEAHKSLVDQLQERTVSRVYIAVAWGKLISKMEIIKSLGRNKYNRKKFSVSENSYAKESQTNINPVGYGTVFNRPVSIIECQLKTGRTHQIRVHLEYVNHPIIGDKTYKKGAPTITGLKIERQALHAKSLSFVHPCSNENVKFYSNIPTDILDLMTLAGAI